MYRVDINESFLITVALWDEETGENASGKTVFYDIRDDSDNPLAPPKNGSLIESTAVSGIYHTSVSFSNSGNYICYAYCNDFYSSSEEIIVNPENIYDLTKQNQNQNISVEDVIRTTASGNETASQLVRNVPYQKTDYILTKIKADTDVDWSNPVASGTTYAHYHSVSDTLPFRMGGDGL